jgi:hypothetical protein
VVGLDVERLETVIRRVDGDPAHSLSDWLIEFRPLALQLRPASAPGSVCVVRMHPHIQ